MGRRRRTVEEIQQLLPGYRTSGMTQEQYCRRVGMALSTLSRYLRRYGNGQRLVQVKVEAEPGHDRQFVLVLVNGRRIETGWRSSEAELARLIRIAEAV